MGDLDNLDGILKFREDTYNLIISCAEGCLEKVASRLTANGKKFKIIEGFYNTYLDLPTIIDEKDNKTLTYLIDIDDREGLKLEELDNKANDLLYRFNNVCCVYSDGSLRYKMLKHNGEHIY